MFLGCANLIISLKKIDFGTHLLKIIYVALHPAVFNLTKTPVKLIMKK